MNTAVSRALSVIGGRAGSPGFVWGLDAERDGFEDCCSAPALGDDEEDDDCGSWARANSLRSSAIEFMRSTPHSPACFRMDSGSEASFCVSLSSLASRDLVDDDSVAAASSVGAPFSLL